MPLRIELGPFERIVIGEAVLINSGTRTSFLIDGDGMIVKLYQGFADARRIAEDSNSIPVDTRARIRLALPFEGLLVQDAFERNDFTYGVALYQHGFLDQAAESFRQVIASKPDNANAYYNLGTLNLRRSRPNEAKEYLQKTVDLRPDERGQYYLLSVTANDRTGLLFAIANVLTRYRINLHTAKIMTLGERVEDVFLVDGAALNIQRNQLQLETELLDALKV